MAEPHSSLLSIYVPSPIGGIEEIEVVAMAMQLLLPVVVKQAADVAAAVALQRNLVRVIKPRASRSMDTARKRQPPPIKKRNCDRID
jgi:hypothetical protein